MTQRSWHGLGFFIGFSILQSGSALGQLNDPCIEIRGVIDVGSEVTKLRVSKINACLGYVQSRLFQYDIKVPYKETLEQDPNHSLSKEIIRQGIEAATTLRDMAQSKFSLKRFKIFATGAFREAENRAIVLNSFIEHGVPIQVLNEQDEGTVGFYALSAGSGIKIEKTVVWQIGGSTIHFSKALGKKDGKSRYFTYHNPFGSIPFKNEIITDIQKASGIEPQPMTQLQLKQAQALAEKRAKDTVSAEIKSALKEPGSLVIGMGGVLYNDMRTIVPPNGFIDRRILETELTDRANGTSPATPTSLYANTRVTNLLLVLGFMKALEIEKFKPVDIVLADGLLLYPEAWLEK